MVVKIKGDSIKLSQFLKKIDETQSGGQSKFFIKNNSIKINGEAPQGRSSKIKPGDIVWVNDTLIKVVSEE
ncbi:RNA-binding S4 domain-containing protein [Mycoplasmopsis columboralis]|uniref:S4-like RNA binding protein n=1 Tax=Mycoplasmopsis columboralis TaxID=171282 RepID=A0A449B6U2_9BACT|nr:RNA-binding S4 domain-containing protein [Mycoplasmopsis columboralis]VEU76323.1 S4-like RNA binding protein [Mycoplasmopsis columboralis]